METVDVGQEVKLTLKGQVFQGTVFCFDRENDVIVLEEPHPQSILKQDVRMVKLSLVDKLEKVGPAPKGPPPALPEIPEELLAKREKEALVKAEKELSKIGKDVPREAQLVFDTLDKTYTLKWHGKDIITNLGVAIRPPYTPESCIGKDAAALERIKKIVATIRQRIASGDLQ